MLFSVEEKGHEAKKEAHKEAAEEKGVIGQIGDTISNAYNYVAEKVHGKWTRITPLSDRMRTIPSSIFVEATSATSYEAHKQQVKDSDNTIGERVGAGFSAVGDKIEEKAHKAKAEAHKEAL